MSTVTCQTDGCTNAGHPIEVNLFFTDDEGETGRVDSVQCGVCGNEITDLKE